MQSLDDVALAIVLVTVLLLVGKGIRRVVPLFDRIFLPTSIIAGVLGLALGPQIAGKILAGSEALSGGFIPAAVLDVWGQMPRLLISVVFAGLFIGKMLPPPKRVWYMGGPQAFLGYTISLGQYAVGLFVTLFFLTPFFDVNPLAGVLVEISMSGGHGTAAGLAGTFAELEFEAGQDMALGLATVGLIVGVVLGTAFINYAVRSDAITIAREEPVENSENFELTAIQDNEAVETVPTTTTDPLTLHLGLVAVAIVIGYALLRGLIFIETHSYGPYTGELMRYVPLFPMAMIGGALLQMALMASGLAQWVSRDLINRICGTALDFIIVSAMATISLSSIGDNWVAFTTLAVAGIGWVVFCFWILAPRMLPERWFEKAIGDFGQGTGMAVSGLLLMRVADPHNRSGAFECFGYKQLPFEPFLGGGLVTALALPLCARFGPGVLLVVFAVGTVLATGTGIRLFGASRKGKS